MTRRQPQQAGKRMRLQTEHQVREQLAAICKAAGGQIHIAKEIGVSPTAVNAVVRGKRKPHPCVLKFLGLKKVTMYIADRHRSE